MSIIFKNVNESSSRTYFNVQQIPNGVVVGEYLGSYQGKFGINHEIYSRELGKIVINGCGTLNKAMEKVHENELIQIKYNGLNKISRGQYAGRDFHDVTVLVAQKED